MTNVRTAIAAGTSTDTLTVTLSALDAFERGMGAWGVQVNRERDGVTLSDKVLIEDDGPGIGSDCEWLKNGRGPTAEIGGEACVKKILHIERLPVVDARLFIPAGVNARVNGVAIDIPAGGAAPKVAASFLKRGDNEIILTGKSDDKTSIKIARRSDIVAAAPDRKSWPARSFKSADGGKTWQPIDGELMIRLALTQYAEEGNFISSAIDLSEANDGVADSKISLQNLSITHEGETPRGTQIEFAVRTSSGSFWTEWESLPLKNSRHEIRYVQWKAILRSNDPKLTPTLRSITCATQIARIPAGEWTKAVTVLASHNETLRHTSMPFIYENSNHPKLVELRRKYKLDEVVRGAKSELEQMVRLRNWVAHQWKWCAPENYPAFDADEIISRQTGFCVHFAVVFIQCALSLGHQARFVFGWHPGVVEGGHEVAEYWSNDYGKWILMDPASTDNRHYVDPKTLEPLSMLEVHERMLRACYNTDASGAVTVAAPRDSSEIAICNGLELVPAVQNKKDVLTKWPPWAIWSHLRYIPRNNFYDETATLPKYQGWNWDWTGYWCWLDERTPADCRYRHFTERKSDLNWSINQVCFSAACSSEAGAIDMRLSTCTPNFDSFLVSVDGKEWESQPQDFTWPLHPGNNRLAMRVRNTAGVKGRVSSLELQYERPARM